MKFNFSKGFTLVAVSGLMVLGVITITEILIKLLVLVFSLKALPATILGGLLMILIICLYGLGEE